MTDDRRYMPHEIRAIDDRRYRGARPVAATRPATSCYCGKTVIAVHGRPTGVKCPRHCTPPNAS